MLSNSFNSSANELSSTLTTPHQFSQFVRNHDAVNVIRALASAQSATSARSLLTTHDHDGQTALHWSVFLETPEFIATLLAYLPYGQVDVRSSAPSQFNQTPLHWACLHGNVQTVNALLGAGADSSLTDCKGYNAVLHAAHYGHVDVVHILLKREKNRRCGKELLAKSIDLTGNSVVQWAAYYGHIGVVRYITVGWRGDVHVDHVDRSGATALHRAAAADNIDVLDLLLRAGADVDIEDGSGKNALQLAPKHSRTASLISRWERARKRNTGNRNQRHVRGRSSRRYGDGGGDDLEDGTGSNNSSSSCSSVSSYSDGQIYEEWMGQRRYSIQNYGLVVFYFMVMICSLIAFYIVIIKEHAGMASGSTHVFFIFLVIVCVISHITTAFGNPGDVDKMSADEFVQFVDRASQNQLKSSSKDRSKHANGVMAPTSTSLLPSAFCYVCLAERPARSRHSRLRDACVRRFDHECPWVNNSVGLYTHKALVLLVTATLIAQTIFIMFVFKVSRQDVNEHNSDVKGFGMMMLSIFEALAKRPGLALLIVTHLVVIVFCIFLCVSQARLIAKGATTNETILRKNARNERCKHKRRRQCDSDHDGHDKVTAGNQDDDIEEGKGLTQNNGDGEEIRRGNVMHERSNDYDLGLLRNLVAFITSSGPGTGLALVSISVSSLFNALIETFLAPWATTQYERNK